MLIAATALFACGEAAPDPPSGSGEQLAPTVAELICDGKTNEVTTPEVRPQTDGVHVHIVNTSGKDLTFTVELPGGGGRGDSAPLHEGILVLPIDPGTARLGCSDFEKEIEPALASLDVLLPEGRYVANYLQCAPGEGAVSQDSLSTAGAKGEDADPVDIIKSSKADLIQPGDEVLRAGYLNEEEASVALVREDRTVALFHFFPTRKGGWLGDSESRCASA
jgi:hypothetical protein